MARRLSQTGCTLARVVPRRFPPESVLAWAAAGVGVIGIVSALTPELANRSQLVGGAPARRAYRRESLCARIRHRPHLALALAGASPTARLAARRRRGGRISGRASRERAGLRRVDDLVPPARRARPLPPPLRRARRSRVRAAAAHDCARGLAAAAATLGLELRDLAVPEDLVHVFWAVGLVVGFYALFLWLRPLSQVVAQTVGELPARTGARRDLRQRQSSFFSLRHDKSFFFSPTRRAFLAYRVVAGAALVSGDPVGDASEFDALLAEFRRVAHARGWRLAVLGASAEFVPRCERLGMRAISIGSEAVLRPR